MDNADYVLLFDAPCPICGCPGTIFHQQYQPAGSLIIRPRWRLNCACCGEATDWTESRDDAEIAWIAYARLARED